MTSGSCVSIRWQTLAQQIRKLEHVLSVIAITEIGDLLKRMDFPKLNGSLITFVLNHFAWNWSIKWLQRECSWVAQAQYSVSSSAQVSLFLHMSALGFVHFPKTNSCLWKNGGGNGLYGSSVIILQLFFQVMSLLGLSVITVHFVCVHLHHATILPQCPLV